MSVHQIIYTSCMRGINGVNDGQQIYSYDAAFKAANNDEIKSLFTYQHPALETGVVMSEEIAMTMPKSFTYKRLENGACALALNTYLGRDYMGGAGRFGNHLSHVIIFDAEDGGNYPAEYYGSTLLRTHMEFEEVNNPNKPDYLPAPALERGRIVDIDAVVEFLSVDDRLEVYKKMLHAMLAFERERKRLVICDNSENIILWIAALEYALPLRNALNVNFSTYVFDPALSSSQICGVVSKGTRFNAESHRLHFVFDLLNGQIPEFALEPDFYDFIDTAMAFSYESLQDFHFFICDGYRYDKADEKIYAAYSLYSLLSDGMGSADFSKLDRGLNFADEFATSEEIHRILSHMISEAETLLRGDKAIFLRVVEFALNHASELGNALFPKLKGTIVDRVLYEFLNEDVVEAEYTALYEKINTLSTAHDFSVTAELMRQENRAKLFSAMRQNIAAWQITFIVRVISDYVKDQKLPVSQLLIDAPLGQIYYGIVQAVYTQSQQNGFLIVTKILEAFSSNCTYLVNMGLNLEGMLLDLPDASQETAAMWKYFGQLMLSRQPNSFDAACSIFVDYRRYDQVYMLYTLALSRVNSPEQCRSVYEKHCRSFVVKDQAYAAQYFERVLEAYFRSLAAFDNDATYENKAALLDTLITQKMDAHFADELIEELVKPIPLDEPSKASARLIQDIFKYTNSFKRQPVSGKVLLLLIGMVVEGMHGKQGLYEKLENLEKLMQGNKADLSRATDKSVQTYFDWLLPNVCRLCDRTADIEAIYDLFDMPSPVEAMFFAQCAKLYLKQCKGEKDYSLFCEFLGAVFKKAASQSREEVGKVLCKLNKQKMEDLDSAVSEYFREDDRALRSWKDIRDTAESTNPLFNNLTNLFRRRKE